MPHKINADAIHRENNDSFQDVLDEVYYAHHYHQLASPTYADHSEVRKYDSFGRMIMTDQPGDNVRRKAITSERGQVIGLRNAEQSNAGCIAGMIIGLVLFVGVIYWLAYVGQQYPGF